MRVNVGRIIAFESGELGARDTLELFGELIASGAAWSLQGSYGRTAAALIDAGHIDRAGAVNLGTLAELEAEAEASG